MTLCLYECLRAVGLQHHYARFTSVGVCRASHLSALTMEDYPLLGIRTMQDRTRLFNLVQLVKTPDVHHRPSDCLKGENTKPDITRGISMYSCDTRLPSFRQPKNSVETVTSKTFNNNPFGHKERKVISRRQNSFTKMGSNEVIGHMAKPTPMYEAKRTAGYNYGLPLRKQRISVCVRKRPLTRAENRRGDADVVTTPGGECVTVHESKESVDLTQYILQHRFYYDQVFGEESSNEEVYRRTPGHLLFCSVFQSLGKATCFAYGQTGAGKTHTMLGSSPRRPGLYALAVRDIFAHLATRRTHSSLQVYVSFFEIYCGQLYDLLDHRKRLFAREDGQKVVHIMGLRDVRVDSVSSLLEVISQGSEERTQGMSGINPLSSRSHALLQIQLRDQNQQITGRMWFVDLAGSERASDAKEPDRQSRMEGAEINQSLLALKECIRSLDQEQSHTPFRQSKLTQVLRDSFVGDSMTCMIANISPGHTATEHTLNTLRYADRRRGKTAPSPKHNLSTNNSSSSSGSSSGIRGKSPPKKPKLGRNNEDFGLMTPTTRLPVGSTILCSTPKNSRSGKETNPSARKGIGLEHVTPVGGWLRMDKRQESKGAGQIDSRWIENKSYADTGSRAVSELRARTGPVIATSSGVEKLRVRDLQKADDRDKERAKHLRRYHEQLQQFIPSSTSSSAHLFSPSTSFTSSTQQSLSSSVSPSSLRHTSHFSVSACMGPGLEEVLNAHAAKVEVDGNRAQQPSPSGEIHLQTETSAVYNNNDNEDAHSHSGGVGVDWRVSWEGQFGLGRAESENRRSVEATGETRLRTDDRTPAWMEGGERRYAWLPTTEREPANRMTGAIPTHAEAQLSYICDSKEVRVEGLDASDVLADGGWSTEQGAADSLASAHSNSDSNSLFNHPAFESPHQRSPAERPLSPVCEHTSTFLTPDKLSDVSLDLKCAQCTANTIPLPLQNTPEAVPSSSDSSETEPWFAANASRRHFSHAQSTLLPLTSSNSQIGWKTPSEPLHKLSRNLSYTPDIKGKMSVLPRQETYADSFSSFMDPLSISLLQVDQQAATVSFLQGDNSSTSPTSVEKIGEDEDGEFRLSLLEPPQGKTRCPPTSSDMLSSLQDRDSSQKLQITPALGSKAPGSPLRPSTCASMQTSAMSPSVQHVGNTASASLHNLMTNATQMQPEYVLNEHKKTLSAITTPQLEMVSGHLDIVPNQPLVEHSNHSSKSNISLQQNNPAESNGQGRMSNQQISPTIPLFTLDDSDHVK
uniref:Kinesin motor domain-containing protein n=1 Tax=Amphiprion percula TaxID=161767 RepID=A0A3P8U8H8_AMPPE